MDIDSHVHTPGCKYRGTCSCGWESNVGDGDNAYHSWYEHQRAWAKKGAKPKDHLYRRLHV